MKRVVLLFLVLVFNAGLSTANIKDQLKQTIDEYLANRFLNATFRFENGEGKTLATGAKGVYNLTGRQLPAEQKMPIASGTKPITAAAILKLQEKKLLNIEDKIIKHLGDDSGLWKDKKAPYWSRMVTIHHLLTHSSGLPEYVMAMNLDLNKQHAEINKDILNFAASRTLEFEPGRQHKYTNTNFVILGLIIEKISGKTLAEFFQDEFFTPLGMKNTHLASLKEAIELQTAPEKSPYPSRYFVTPTGGKPQFTPAKSPFILVPFADGGVISNTRDMVKWYRSLSTGKAISDRSFKMMTRKYNQAPDKAGRKVYAGYGIFMSDLPSGDKVIYHGGSAIAMRSESGYIPSKDLYFSILSNVSVHIPEDKKDKIDVNSQANQLDIFYFREAIFKAIQE